VAKAMGFFALKSLVEGEILIRAAGVLSRSLSSRDRSDFWKSISSDCARLSNGLSVIDLFTHPVWNRSSVKLATKRGTNLEVLTWLRWYNGFLVGSPVRLDALVELSRTSDGTANEKSSRFAALHLIELAALPEQVVIDHDSGKFRLIPQKIDSDRRYQNALRKVRDDIARLKSKTGTNAYSALQDVVELIEHTLENYADEPMAVHDDFAKALKMILRKIESQDVPHGDDLIVNLADDLNTGTIDIRIVDETVAKAFNARIRLRLRKPTPDESKSLISEIQLRVTQSDKRLAQELMADAEAIVKFRPTNSEVINLSTEQAVQRVSGRLPQMQSTAIDNKSGVERLVDAADKASKLQKGAEAVGAGVGFATKWVYYLYSMFS
jgi:hypothetical protein